jgi:NADPH-dependent curcumin reductase CurA
MAATGSAAATAVAAVRRAKRRSSAYSEWRQRQIEELDRDYDEYRREHQSKFEQEFGGWRQKRQTQRQHMGRVTEQMEVLGSDGQHIGTVDKVRGDRIILTKSDENAGGIHHSIPCSWIESVEDKVTVNKTAEEAMRAWKDEDQNRALFERRTRAATGPHMLNRSFSGTYDETRNSRGTPERGPGGQPPGPFFTAGAGQSRKAVAGETRRPHMTTTRAWHLKSRPTGMPDMSNFELKELDAAGAGGGHGPRRNSWLSVDPYMRGRMNDVKSYVPPFEVGAPLQGGAVGKVVESRAPAWSRATPSSTCSAGARGGRQGRAFQQGAGDGRRDQQWLGNLGLTGATAYFGLLRAAEAKEGRHGVRLRRGGCVGSAVVQIAKAKGMTVIGSAGGPEKCAWVRELGADAAIDYKAGPIVKAADGAAPKGIDVYFDNVGGDHLDAAFATARNNARFAICGMIEAIMAASRRASATSCG